MAKQSLLERALAIETPRKISSTQEDVELVLAWLTDIVTGAQLTKVKGFRSGGQYPFIATMLREAYRQGIIIVKTKEKGQ